MSKKNTIYSPALCRDGGWWGVQHWWLNNWLFSDNWLCSETLSRYALVDKARPLWIGLSTNKPAHQEYAIVNRISGPATILPLQWSAISFNINGENGTRRPGIVDNFHQFVYDFVQDNKGETIYIWLEQ